MYVGTSDTERDLASWLAIPGARLRWRFHNFGADVAAVDLGTPPLVLLADHRPAGSVLPIFAVDGLDATGAALAGAGWALEMGPVGTPEGLTSVWCDASGTMVALLEVERPDALDGAYGDQTNSHAIRSATS